MIRTLDFVLDRAATAAACFAILIGIASFIIDDASPFQSSFYFGEHQALHDSSILIFCGAFLVIRFKRFWGPKAFWMIGLMWAMSELPYNSWNFILVPSLVGQFAVPLWDVYIAFVSAFFVLSLLRLRHTHSLQWSPMLVVYAGFIGLTVLHLLTFINVPVYGSWGTSVWELFWDGTIITTVCGIVRMKDPHEQTQEVLA